MSNIRVFTIKGFNTLYLLVYRNEDNAQLHITHLDGKEYEKAELLIQISSGHLWENCRDMGKNIEEIIGNINKEKEEIQKEREERKSELEEQQKQHEAFLQELEQKRLAIAYTLTTLSIPPIDIMQTLPQAEAVLERLKPGVYNVCVNYKKKGYIEIRKKAKASDSLNILAQVTRGEKKTKAELHRFAVAVREVYKSNIEIIGRTHAIKSFGQRIVDSVPHIQELKNPYYSSAAPRKFYDSQTLNYMKLQEVEK